MSTAAAVVVAPLKEGDYSIPLRRLCSLLCRQWVIAVVVSSDLIAISTIKRLQRKLSSASTFTLLSLPCGTVQPHSCKEIVDFSIELIQLDTEDIS